MFKAIGSSTILLLAIVLHTVPASTQDSSAILNNGTLAKWNGSTSTFINAVLDKQDTKARLEDDDNLSIRALDTDISVSYVKEGRVVWNQGSFYGDVTMRVHVTVAAPPNTSVVEVKHALKQDIPNLALLNLSEHDLHDIRCALLNSSTPTSTVNATLHSPLENIHKPGHMINATLNVPHQHINTTLDGPHQHIHKPAHITNTTTTPVHDSKTAQIINATLNMPPAHTSKPTLIVNTTIIAPSVNNTKPAVVFNTTLVTPSRNNTKPVVSVICVPQTADDTVASFTSSTVHDAKSKHAKVPTGYLRAFQGLKSSVDLPTFISSRQLDGYDVTSCAKTCDNISACSGFNVYVERDPVVVPGLLCLKPASRASYRCALFGSFVAESTATNRGKPLGSFEVAITGSNGYNRRQILPNRIDGYTTAIALPGSFDVGTTINGTALLKGPYEPAQCAILCNARNKAVDPAGVKHCAYFNAFLAVLNTKPFGTFCALYATAQPQHQAVKKTIGFRGKKYDVAYSYAYTLEK